MKVLTILCLALSATCLEARLFQLRQDSYSNSCPVPDPLKYTVHLPHPQYCNMFLRCDRGIAKPERCPAPLHFSPVLQICDWPLKAGCKVQGAGAGSGDSNNVDREWNQDVESEIGNDGVNLLPENPIQEQPIPIQEQPIPIQEQPIPDGGNADIFIPNEWAQSGSIPIEEPLGAAEIPNEQTPDEYVPINNEVDEVYLQNGEAQGGEDEKTPILPDVLDEEIFPETKPE